MDVESLIDDLGADIDGAIESEAGLSAEDRDVFGARVADLSSEIDAIEASGTDVSQLRSFLDSVDYKLVRAERQRPELAQVDTLPTPQASTAPGPDIER